MPYCLRVGLEGQEKKQRATVLLRIFITLNLTLNLNRVWGLGLRRGRKERKEFADTLFKLTQNPANATAFEKGAVFVSGAISASMFVSGLVVATQRPTSFRTIGLATRFRV